MRFAIIADIHGNLAALEAVLADIDQQQIDRIVDLGDFVGYGPEPEDVTQLLRELQIAGIVGNHEVALTDDELLNYFSVDAFESIIITRQLISEQTLEYIKTLPVFLTVGNLRFVHGTPPDSYKDYINYYGEHELRKAFASTPEWITFVGHTHQLGLYESDAENKNIHTFMLKKGCRQLSHQSKYIVNVGSVGQPRDENNSAKYVIFDDETDALEVRAVPYDVEHTIRLIQDIGLPESNAYRLL